MLHLHRFRSTYHTQTVLSSGNHVGRWMHHQNTPALKINILSLLICLLHNPDYCTQYDLFAWQKSRNTGNWNWVLRVPPRYISFWDMEVDQRWYPTSGETKDFKKDPLLNILGKTSQQAFLATCWKVCISSRVYLDINAAVWDSSLNEIYWVGSILIFCPTCTYEYDNPWCNGTSPSQNSHISFHSLVRKVQPGISNAGRRWLKLQTGEQLLSYSIQLYQSQNHT